MLGAFPFENHTPTPPHPPSPPAIQSELALLVGFNLLLQMSAYCC